MSSYGQGTTGNWRAIRQQVLDRDQHECQLRYTGCTGIAIEVHHQVGITEAGLTRSQADNNPATCIAVCHQCHLKLTERQKRAGQQRAQALRNQRKRLPQRPHPGEMAR